MPQIASSSAVGAWLTGKMCKFCVDVVITGLSSHRYGEGTTTAADYSQISVEVVAVRALGVGGLKTNK